MIDLSLLREDPSKVKTLIAKKEPGFGVDLLIKLDKDVRALRVEVETLRKERNDISKAGKGITEEQKSRSIEIGKSLKTKEPELEETEKNFKYLWLSCPNIITDDVPEGNKESNKVVKVFGEKKDLSFKPLNHIELGEKLNWFDFEAAAAMSGANFALYKGDAVKLIYALTQLMIRTNVKHGFSLILPPELVTEKSLINSGNLPKFAEDVYKITDDGLYLIPTAEVSLTNLYSNKILTTSSLPIRHCAWTSCFRREAGGYGAQERGLIRIHQFEKVELYTICKSEDSSKEQEKMLACAEEILQKLGLHYQVSLLAAQDCSFSSSKTYDVEVWLPGQDRYYEVSSISNCTDFQARRAALRHREEGEKPVLAHTLNASSLALPRLMVALMETYQTESGDIAFPEALQEILNSLW